MKLFLYKNILKKPRFYIYKEKINLLTFLSLAIKSQNQIKLINKSIIYSQQKKVDFIKFYAFYKKLNIIIKYTTLYKHQKNRQIKQKQKNIITIKKVMLIDNGLSNNFGVKIIKIFNYIQNKFFIKNKNYKKLMFKKT